MIAADDRRTRRGFIALALVLAGTFAALHVPFLPQSLEDLDSINFALGMRRFDVAQHQPHPPGYPLFILLARAMSAVCPREATALAAVSVMAGAAGALAIVGLHRRMFRAPWPWSIAAGALAVTSPLYWLTASRPLSDMTGLAVAIAVQAATVGARTNDLMAAALCAGLATGIRSQVFWLTAPLLVWAVARARAPGDDVARRWVAIPAAFVVGVSLWFVPLVAMSGGLRAYWRALSSQGGEDLSGIQMLWTTPTLRTLLDALYYAFVAPWAVWPPAIIVVIASALGVVVLWRGERRQLVLLAVGFGPYLAFDMLFQETFTSRYALPLVVPVAFLAARGLQTLPAPSAWVALGGLVMWNAHVGGRSVAALGSEAAPAFRLLADMRAANVGAIPVLAPDRRQSFDLRRPLVWLGDAAPVFARQLPAPPQHEWLEAVKYWNEGGRAPVWFVVDPRRASIDLIQHGRPSRYDWPAPYPILMSGTRPGGADWYRVDGPDWYVGEGWSLTPEAAGVAERDRRGLQYGPIDAWVHRSVLRGGGLLLGGRNFEPRERATVSVAIDRIWSTTLQVRPGWFLQLIRMPSDDLDPSVPEYVKLDVSVQPVARVAIEQFDVAPSSRAVLGFGEGWHEHELDATTGRQWRWLSDRGELRYIAPEGWSLHVEGESPARYYSHASRIIVRSGERELREVTVSSDFSFDVALPEALQPSTIVVGTDQTHVPAETGWRLWRPWRKQSDRRRLGLRIFRCELRPVSSPDRAASFPPAR